MTDWGQPLISVDVVACKRVGGELRYAVHNRLFEPYVGRSALPGVLLLTGETLAAAAQRAVVGKLGLPGSAIAAITQFGAFDGTNRDPRGATISIGHIVLLGYGAGESTGESTGESRAEWARLASEPLGLPFDHDYIVDAASAEVARRLWSDWGFTASLLGSTFTTGEAIAVTHQVDGRLPAPETNLSRWLKSSGHVTKVGLRGRDTVWEWA